MIYITGDTHRNFKRVRDFCEKNNTSKEDILIILGDVGINYYLDESDLLLKEELQELPITLFCIRGNHEARPENINTYITSSFWDGEVYIEPNFPNLKYINQKSH